MVVFEKTIFFLIFYRSSWSKLSSSSHLCPSCSLKPWFLTKVHAKSSFLKFCYMQSWLNLEPTWTRLGPNLAPKSTGWVDDAPLMRAWVDQLRVLDTIKNFHPCLLKWWFLKKDFFEQLHVVIKNKRFAREGCKKVTLARNPLPRCI